MGAKGSEACCYMQVNDRVPGQLWSPTMELTSRMQAARCCLVWDASNTHLPEFILATVA